MPDWSVIRTRSRWEKKVAQTLQCKGFECYCLLQKAKHQWSDRVKTVEKPILQSYVFVKAAKEQRTAVRLTEGVINFLSRDGKPIVVTEKVIQGLRKFQQTNTEIQVVSISEPAYNNEESVRLSGGKSLKTTLCLEMLDLVLVGEPCVVTS